MSVATDGLTQRELDEAQVREEEAFREEERARERSAERIREDHERYMNQAPRTTGDADPEPVALEVSGPVQLSMFDLGGMVPETATLKFNGGKITLADGTAFRKGETVRFEGVAVVNVIAQKDAHDAQTGVVVSSEQRHEARITELRVVTV